MLYVPGGAPGFAEQGPFASNQGILNHGRNVVLFPKRTSFLATDDRSSRSAAAITASSITSLRRERVVARQQALGIPGANLGGESCGLTSTQLDGGYWSLGDRGFSPFVGGTNVFTFSDTVNLVRGKHDIRAGLQIRANQMNVLTEGFQDGYWIFTGLWSGEPEADLLLGLPSLAIHDQTFNGNVTGRRWKMFRPYIQDDWRVSKSLTLNLGLAWALTSRRLRKPHNRQADFDPATRYVPDRRVRMARTLERRHPDGLDRA